MSEKDVDNLENSVNVKKENNSETFLFMELLAISSCTGKFFHLWWVGLLVFLVFFIFMLIPYLRDCLVFGLTLIWPIFAYVMLKKILTNEIMMCIVVASVAIFSAYFHRKRLKTLIIELKNL